MVQLPEAVFGVRWNADLVHQVVTSMQSNARAGTAQAKTRGEVRGGGKKPWKQKGTGQARHGSIRSPIWIGGGTTHGPRGDKNYERKINRRMKVRALAVALSQKLKDGEIIFVDALPFAEPKTRDARAFLSALSHIKGFARLGKRTNAALIALPAKHTATEKSFRNVGNVALEEVRNINPVDVLSYAYIIVVSPDIAVAALEKRVTENKKLKTKN